MGAAEWIDRATWDKWSPAAGILFVALLIASDAVLSQPPDVKAPNGKFVAFALHHHRAGLISGILTGLAVIAFLWFIGSLTTSLREAGEARVATIALGSGIVLASFAIVADVIETSIFYRVALDDPGRVKGLFDITSVAFTMLGFPVAALAAATAVAALRTSFLPLWYGWAGTLAAVFFLTTGAALKQVGFFSPTGAYGFIGLIVFLLWMLTTSILLLRRASSVELPAASPAAT